jgi:hypothetical protein
MALFKPFRGVRTELPAEMHDGYAYFCTDDGTFHIDYVDSSGNLQRKQVCGNYTSGDVEALIAAHNTDTSAHNAIRTSIDEVSSRLDRVVTVPAVSASNNGQFLRVVNGQWTATTIANAEEVEF